jgi:hypothetical protein
MQPQSICLEKAAVQLAATLAGAEALEVLARQELQEHKIQMAPVAEVGEVRPLHLPQPMLAARAALAAAREVEEALHLMASTPELVALAAQATPASTLGEVTT